MSQKNNNQLSVVINVRNAASTFSKCLESVKFAKEIIVVDMESTDDSLKIAKRYTENIYSHKNIGYADPARNFALSKATQNWILVIDADEEIPPVLKTKILSLIEKNDDVTGYYLPRKNIISGKWISHTGWWPDHQLRLFKNGTVKWAEGVHRQPDILGKVVFLADDEENAITHHNYENLSEFIERLNRYTNLHAQERAKISVSVCGLEEYALKTFFDEFIRRYFACNAALDGVHGTTLSLAQSFYELSVFFKQFESERIEGVETKQIPQKYFRHLQKEINYWLADYQVKNSHGISRLLWMVRRRLCL